MTASIRGALCVSALLGIAALPCRAQAITYDYPQVTCPSGATTIAVGANIQSALTAGTTGQTFCLPAGVWHGQQFTPKSGQKIIGDPNGGTVLTGDDTGYIYSSDGTADLGGVLIANIVIEHYRDDTSECSLGAIHGTNNWHFVNVTAQYNNCTGLNVGPNTVVSGGRFVANKHAGIENGGSSGIVIQGAEIAYNNTRGDAQDNDAAGIKFGNTSNASVINNWVHHNNANGIWIDVSSSNIIIDGNTVHDNASTGIKYEISTTGTIRDNVSLRNAGRQIEVSSSGNVSVYGNNVTCGDYNHQDCIIAQTDTGRGGADVGQNIVLKKNTVNFLDSGASKFGFLNYAGATSTGTTSNSNTFNVTATGQSHFVWNSHTTPGSFTTYKTWLSGLDSSSLEVANMGHVAGCQSMNCVGAGVSHITTP